MSDVKVSVSPKDATNQGFSVSSSNEKVVKIDGKKGTGVGAGEAVITITTEDGKHTAEVAVTVKAKAEE